MGRFLSRELFRYRGLSPKSLRQLYRLIRLASVPRQDSVSIPQELLDQCQVCGSRKLLVSKLTPRGRVAEVGTARGKFARIILEVNNPVELHLIDLDLSNLLPELVADKRVELHEGLSFAVLSRFPDAYFDWIYIDADHSYDGVRRDIKAAATKVKRSGFLAFDDFCHVDLDLGSYGVQRAVLEFAVEERWPFAWFAMERKGTYNVAIRRP